MYNRRIFRNFHNRLLTERTACCQDEEVRRGKPGHVKYEAIKQHIREKHQQQAIKYNFFFPFRSEHPLSEAMREIKENLEKVKINKKF